jgi:pimeloyl-ACP methyl ester carboxylesterase
MVPEKVRGSAVRRGVLLAAAAALCGMSLAVAARARRAERKYPPLGRFVVIDGVRVRLREWGRGDPILLIHGNGSLIEEFEVSGFIEKLSEHHWVIAIDRPGFGYSDRPRSRVWTAHEQARLIDRLLERLGLSQAVVYGHSLGAQVAAELAIVAPFRVRALVLASGYYYPTFRPEIPLFAAPGIPVIGDVLRYTLSPLITARLLPWLYAKLFAPAPIPRRFWRNFPHELLLRPRHLRATGADTALMISNAIQLERRIERLQAPVWILTGDGDEVVFMRRHAAILHRALPKSRLVVVKGAGHMVHHSQPAAAAAVIAEAVQGT